MSLPQLLHLARDCLSSFLCSGVVVHAFGWLYQVDDLKEAMRSEAGWLFGTRTLKASGHLSFVLPSGMLLKLHENVRWMISEAGRSSSLFVLV